MLYIDKQIMNIDQVICSNIDFLNFSGVTRGVISQNLLGQSRNLVEHIALKRIAMEQILGLIGKLFLRH